MERSLPRLRSHGAGSRGERGRPTACRSDRPRSERPHQHELIATSEPATAAMPPRGRPEPVHATRSQGEQRPPGPDVEWAAAQNTTASPPVGPSPKPARRSLVAVGSIFRLTARLGPAHCPKDRVVSSHLQPRPTLDSCPRATRSTTPRAASERRSSAGRSPRSRPLTRAIVMIAGPSGWPAGRSAASTRMGSTCSSASTATSRSTPTSAWVACGASTGAVSAGVARHGAPGS